MLTCKDNKKMDKTAKNMLLIIFSVLLCINTAAQGDWKREQTSALATISPGTLYNEISFLADTLCGGRATGTGESMAAAFMIARKFSNFGLLPLTDGYASHFTCSNGTCGHNIMGMIPGSYTMPSEKYFIVGAHYDHLGRLDGKLYPGADANASGTAVLTALAEIFSEMKKTGRVYDTNIIFAAFDAKEMNMAGSFSLWKLIEYGLLKDPITGNSITKDKITGMANIDQIGSSLSPIRSGRRDYMLMLGTESLPKDKRNNLETCNVLSGSSLDLCLSYYGSRTFTEVFYKLSDQKIFVENRVPAVFFTSGITMNNNKTRDTAESLDYEVLHKRLQLIYHWIESML